MPNELNGISSSKTTATPLAQALQRGKEASVNRMVAIYNLSPQKLTEDLFEHSKENVKIRCSTFSEEWSKALFYLEHNSLDGLAKFCLSWGFYTPLCITEVSLYQTTNEDIIPNVKKFVQNNPVFETVKTYIKAKDTQQ